jgi:hypothetical protein
MLTIGLAVSTLQASPGGRDHSADTVWRRQIAGLSYQYRSSSAPDPVGCSRLLQPHRIGVAQASDVGTSRHHVWKSVSGSSLIWQFGRRRGGGRAGAVMIDINMGSWSH